MRGLPVFLGPSARPSPLPVAVRVTPGCLFTLRVYRSIIQARLFRPEFAPHVHVHLGGPGTPGSRHACANAGGRRHSLKLSHCRVHSHRPVVRHRIYPPPRPGCDTIATRDSVTPLACMSRGLRASETRGHTAHFSTALHCAQRRALLWDPGSHRGARGGGGPVAAGVKRW